MPHTSGGPLPPTYGSCPRVDELFSLQTPASAGPDGAAHDEILPIPDLWELRAEL